MNLFVVLYALGIASFRVIELPHAIGWTLEWKAENFKKQRDTANESGKVRNQRNRKRQRFAMVASTELVRATPVQYPQP